MQNSERTKLVELNELLTCILCKGYFIDATTIIECLHSFCRTCIVTYLQTNKHCPACEVQVHKTRPLSNIRSDQTLQDIVYKIVPGLFKNEMKRRRDFYRQNDTLIQSSIPTSSEKRGDVWGCDRLIFTSEDIISVSIEYSPLYEDSHTKSQTNPTEKTSRRYFRCPGALKVYHLKKLLRAKYNLTTPTLQVDILYRHDILKDEYTLVDLAYIYAWKRNEPLRLYYKVTEVSEEEISESIEEAVEEKTCSIVLNLPSSPTPVSSPRIPLPSIATAPTSRHPSPPASPQMATEPNDFRMGNPRPQAAKRRRPPPPPPPPEGTPRSILKRTSQFEGQEPRLNNDVEDLAFLNELKRVSFSVNLVEECSEMTPKSPIKYQGHRKLFKLEPVNGSTIRFGKKSKSRKSS